MAVKVQVTSVIQKVVDDQREFDAEGATVGELIENISSQYPGFRAQIADENGELHRFVNIYLNDEDIRFLSGKDTAISAGDTVAFLPALAGGAVEPHSARSAGVPVPPPRGHAIPARQSVPAGGPPQPPARGGRPPARQAVHGKAAAAARKSRDCGC